MQRIIYQITHPWHWLTYGQNAAALGALSAVLGLIGLFFYTTYTRRMMKLGEATRRATITPILVLRAEPEFIATEVETSPAGELGFTPHKVISYRTVLKIRNIGEGAAVFLRAWAQPVSEKFGIGGATILLKTVHSTDGSSESTELFKGESTSVAFEPLKPSDLQRRWLFVVESIDQANGRHQLHVLRSAAPNVEIFVTMVHGPGDSLGERLEKLAKRCVEILNAITRAFKGVGK